MKKIHYVYKITNLNPTDERLYYIGVRSTSKASPELDTNYRSSSKYLKEAIKEIGHKNFSKEILSAWETRKLAVLEEIRLHNEFDVAKNPLFYNKSKQTSTGFDISGYVSVFDTRDNKTKSVTMKDFANNAYYVSVNYNKVIVLDIRDSKTKSVTLDEYKKYDYYVSIATGTVNVVDKSNTYRRVLKTNIEKDEYTQIKRILINDKNGKYKKVSPDEYESNDNYQTPSTNKVLVKIDNKITTISKDEYASGNYVHMNNGKMPVKDIRDNKTKMICVDEYNNNKEYYIQVCCKRYEIYDSSDNLQHIITTGLERYCKQHGLPFRVLENSYLTHGSPIYKKPNKVIKNNGNIKFKGWYALKVELE